ncbi:MAG: YjbQ family protein [Candidatus Makaraimicrobium thalassicum]|nr:MAG: YjbQ family protein [Candidatus Omnitrophota bacterium]
MSGKNLTAVSIASTRTTQIIDITKDVADSVKRTAISNGICFVYVPHTTAAVTINENADPDVKSDIIMGLENIVPDDPGYAHAEGNSPAHIKSSIIGSSVNILIEDGQLVLGTWQGIYFCEFDGPRSRKVYVRVMAG